MRLACMDIAGEHSIAPEHGVRGVLGLCVSAGFLWIRKASIFLKLRIVAQDTFVECQ